MSARACASDDRRGGEERSTMQGHSFMDVLREVRQEYRPQWRAAKEADQFEDGKRILAAMRGVIVKERPAKAGRGYSYEQGSTGGREALIASIVTAVDATLRETSPPRFWEAGD